MVCKANPKNALTVLQDALDQFVVVFFHLFWTIIFLVVPVTSIDILYCTWQVHCWNLGTLLHHLRRCQTNTEIRAVKMIKQVKMKENCEIIAVTDLLWLCWCCQVFPVQCGTFWMLSFSVFPQKGCFPCLKNIYGHWWIDIQNWFTFTFKSESFLTSYFNTLIRYSHLDLISTGVSVLLFQLKRLDVVLCPAPKWRNVLIYTFAFCRRWKVKQ